MNITPYDLAKRFIGLKEIVGDKHNPFIQWCLTLCGFDNDVPDEVPWCSAFVNGICWMLNLERSKSALARSWLNVGDPIGIASAQRGFDIAILKVHYDDPGIENVNFRGHVGFIHEIQWRSGVIMLLGGNQGNKVSIKGYPLKKLLCCRRLKPILRT